MTTQSGLLNRRSIATSPCELKGITARDHRWRDPCREPLVSVELAAAAPDAVTALPSGNTSGESAATTKNDQPWRRAARYSANGSPGYWPLPWSTSASAWVARGPLLIEAHGFEALQ
jgi:hypothetical protein